MHLSGHWFVSGLESPTHTCRPAPSTLRCGAAIAGAVVTTPKSARLVLFRLTTRRLTASSLDVYMAELVSELLHAALPVVPLDKGVSSANTGNALLDLLPLLSVAPCALVRPRLASGALHPCKQAVAPLVRAGKWAHAASMLLRCHATAWLHATASGKLTCCCGGVVVWLLGCTQQPMQGLPGCCGGVVVCWQGKRRVGDIPGKGAACKASVHCQNQCCMLPLLRFAWAVQKSTVVVAA